MEEKGNLKKSIVAFIEEHLHRLVGAFIGLIIAVLFLLLGFWQTLLLAFCSGVGWYLGGIQDYKAWLLNIYDKIHARQASSDEPVHANGKIRMIKRNPTDDRMAK